MSRGIAGGPRSSTRWRTSTRGGRRSGGLRRWAPRRGTATATFTAFYGEPGISTEISITNIRSTTGPSADFNNDGRVDIFDAAAYLAAFDAGQQSAEADMIPGLTAGDVSAWLQTFDQFAP
ncbi:MAG: hypothetical protein AAFQ71_15350 [Planctomycetota bacterium]